MPGLQANLFLEGTLGKYYKDAARDEKGIGYISKMFAWPYGFSSHCSPETPGLILEGGELGYSCPARMAQFWITRICSRRC